VAVLVTQLIKEILAVASRQDTWMLLALPLLGLTVSVLALHGVPKTRAAQRIPGDGQPRAAPLRPPRWCAFPLDSPRADLTADVVTTAGEEERFPCWLAPLRAVAIVATVGRGAPMGTEAPAAHLGVAAGSWLGNHPRLRQMVRSAGVGGGAAGVAALMGIALVGTVFMLELGRRRQIPVSLERVVAALAGGGVGWVINVAFDLDLIRLVVPKVPPSDVFEALAAALFIGAIAGAVAALTGKAIYWAKGLRATPVVRLVTGGLTVLACAAAVAILATPAAAFGPGGAAIVWAETAEPTALTLLAIGLLRAAMTTGAVAAGGCGGVFVPFLAIGDIVGRVFAALFGVPPDLAGASGAAAGIAGGYRLPFTAVMMVLGVGGPFTAKLTCLAVVGVATIAAVGCARGLAMLRLRAGT
jgi:H+/Cl- antiporter ClcA